MMAFLRPVFVRLALRCHSFRFPTIHMMSLTFAALLLVIGVGMLGGALFGCLRKRRLSLLGLTLAAWTLATAFFLTGCVPLPPVASPAPSTAVIASPPATTTAAAASPLPTPMAESTFEPHQGKILFASERSGGYDIWQMDLSTPDTLLQITTDPSADVEPRWSHDGAHIVFSSGRDDPNGINEIYTMNSDGSDQKRLVDWPNSYEWGGLYSPDDQWIAFTTTKDGKYEIYLIPSDGSAEPINLPQNDYLDSYPDWSPDGRWLLFVSDRSGNWDIWKMDVQACLAARQEGAQEDSRCDAAQLTTNPDDDFFPRWSPDGKRIAFESRQEVNRDIFVMDADGGNVVRVTTDPERDTSPFWVDNGKAIIYSHDYLPNLDLHIVNPDGSNNHRLTTTPGEDRYGDWRP